MMCVGPIMMLYTLNLHSAVCQLYINKTRGEKREYLVGKEEYSPSIQIPCISQSNIYILI